MAGIRENSFARLMVEKQIPRLTPSIYAVAEYVFRPKYTKKSISLFSMKFSVLLIIMMMMVLTAFLGKHRVGKQCQRASWIVWVEQEEVIWRAVKKPTSVWDLHLSAAVLSSVLLPAVFFSASIFFFGLVGWLVLFFSPSAFYFVTTIGFVGNREQV